MVSLLYRIWITSDSSTLLPDGSDPHQTVQDLRDCAGSPVNEDENRAMLLLEEFIVQQVPGERGGWRG